MGKSIYVNKSNKVELLIFEIVYGFILFFLVFKMSNNLKEILLNIKSGKFKELIDKLDEENATITCSDAVRIIVLCSNICFDVHVIDRIKYEDLSLLVDKTLFYVSDLKDKLLDTYLQSIYFILKYFIEKVKDLLLNFGCL